MSATCEKPGSIVPLLLVAAVTVACLAPFAGKAFDMDDPLFIWVARHIHSHPLDFYGFNINWYGFETPASQVIKNPPLASYYMALAAYLSGWSEPALHLAFLVPALAAATGTFCLARELSSQPLAAALIGILTPVFLLSGSTVMCDTMMLSLYVWAVYLWVRGQKERKLIYSLGAALLVALCGLTKYFGTSLIPLLAVYSLFSRNGKKSTVFLLLLPVAILLLYQWHTANLYGRGLLSDAASYATETREITGLLNHLLIGLSFTGGCLVTSLFYAPFLWRRRFLGGAALLIAVGATSLTFFYPLPFPSDITWGGALQLSLFITAGIGILSIAALDLMKRRDADSLLLFLWVVGTFIFATFVNWSTNGRSILPMAPAVGILVMRRLERPDGEGERIPPVRAMVPLVPAVVIALLVTWADSRQADISRGAAREISRLYGNTPATLWFQGHWGFQYYMEMAGGKAYDDKRPSISSGDIMAIPGGNTNIYSELMKAGTPLQVLQFSSAGFLSTMGRGVGAGFHSDRWGPLPFAFGRVPDETYYVVGFAGPP